MPLSVSPDVLYMVRCNDIHLAKRLQYALLSLEGSPSSSRIGPHIGRDTISVKSGAPHAFRLKTCSLSDIFKRKTFICECEMFLPLIQYDNASNGRTRNKVTINIPFQK
jgi:hypothetical protein